MAGNRKISLEVVEAMKDYFGNECNYCGSKEKLSIHHILPVSRGGRNTLSNLEAICRSCHIKIHEQWNKIMPIKKFALKECSHCGKREFRKEVHKDSIWCTPCKTKERKLRVKQAK